MGRIFCTLDLRQAKSRAGAVDADEGKEERGARLRDGVLVRDPFLDFLKQLPVSREQLQEPGEPNYGELTKKSV